MKKFNLSLLASGVILSVLVLFANLYYCQILSIVAYLPYFLVAFIAAKYAKAKGFLLRNGLSILLASIVLVQAAALLIYKGNWLFTLENSLFYMAAVVWGALLAHPKAYVKIVAVVLSLVCVYCYYELSLIHFFYHTNLQ